MSSATTLQEPLGLSEQSTSTNLTESEKPKTSSPILEALSKHIEKYYGEKK